MSFGAFESKQEAVLLGGSSDFPNDDPDESLQVFKLVHKVFDGVIKMIMITLIL